MRSVLRTSAVLAAFAAILTFASAGLAQRTGGYKDLPKSDADAAAAAAFAVSTQAEKTNARIELVSVQKAESQVVAGRYFRLCLKVTTSGEKGDADVTITVQAVVYQNLQRAYTLTSWKEDDCGEDDDDDGDI